MCGSPSSCRACRPDGSRPTTSRPVALECSRAGSSGASLRASKSGSSTSCTWRGMPTSTWCWSASTGGRWKPRSRSSPRSAASARCDMKDKVVVTGRRATKAPRHSGFRHSVSRCLCGLWLCVAVASAAYAQTPKPGEVETDPIRCWWKTDRTAVRIGERFTLALTCGVVETSSVKVVPTLTQIDPGAIQLTPFEVVGGRRGDDVVAPPWRYVQYEYTLRLLGEGFFGQDVNVPPLTVT